MSNQTDQPPSTAIAGQDAGSSEYGFVFSTFFSLFSSSGPCGDWLKLFVIGGVLELIRRFLVVTWKGLVNQFWITIALEEYNDSHCEPGHSSCHLAASLMKHDYSLDDVMVI